MCTISSYAYAIRQTAKLDNITFNNQLNWSWLSKCLVGRVFMCPVWWTPNSAARQDPHQDVCVCV